MKKYNAITVLKALIERKQLNLSELLSVDEKNEFVEGQILADSETLEFIQTFWNHTGDDDMNEQII